MLKVSGGIFSKQTLLQDNYSSWIFFEGYVGKI